ncbi:S-adenosyl-L-methionine-dependent methyltransferase [Glarea lozoyensis ATCC 20868]|uniref:protein-L-isoaspartate(D-aspartate) O-methyltransferase n=1 Tax=Glarea lozoyensis (strain ATCC 20868 / MF5171) TaxID=1116229 RepID=S3D4G1_GLAL2|nr:S-adenosyl-L-methionine-dependent methyltransferase [Glarea lozoyensis ATCC 20868]EPE26966.1 S-adenosyl-L-methionine-dependent methyltransferase [Glarea lozoyensis ATCC 20868]
MAWQCSGETNTELITNLYNNNLITEPRIRDAMLNVDRAHYAPTSPYTDSPQPIGHAATISAPHMHASAASALLPFLYPGARVLDIGSGSGYLTAVFAELVCADGKGKVVGLEHIEALRELGEGNIRKGERGKAYLEGGGVEFVRGDGRRGWKGKGGGDGEGWDGIHVGAAAVELHEELIEQLKAPGRIFIPVEDSRGDQYIWIVDKDKEGKVTKKRSMGVRYVPLTDAPV